MTSGIFQLKVKFFKFTKKRMYGKAGKPTLKKEQCLDLTIIKAYYITIMIKAV